MASVQLAKLEDVRQRLGANTADDVLLTTLIDEVSDSFERELNRKFKEDTYTEYLSVDGYSDMLLLGQGPLVSVTSVNLVAYGDNGSGVLTETLTLVPASDYLPGGLRTEGNRGGGFLWRRSACWPCGVRNVKVVYVAGLGLTTAALPSALRADAASVVGMAYNRRRAEGLLSHTVGDGTHVPSSEANYSDAVNRLMRRWSLRGWA